jgi:hypothetical protein
MDNLSQFLTKIPDGNFGLVHTTVQVYSILPIVKGGVLEEFSGMNLRLKFIWTRKSGI